MYSLVHVLVMNQHFICVQLIFSRAPSIVGLGLASRLRPILVLVVRYRLFLEIGVDFYISATDFLEIEIYYNKRKFSGAEALLS